MNASKYIFLLTALGAAATAQAQSVDYMLNECENVGHRFYGDYEARTEMKYNGQRVDGTFAVNGQIFLENRAGYFSCSFDRGGREMTEFVADGDTQNAYLPGRSDRHDRGGRHQRADDAGYFVVAGVPGNDILNVRSAPSARSNIVGALANGDRVRDLGCRDEGGSRWCRIQMLDEMRSEGWVNARYLTGAGAPAAPSGGLDHGTSVDNACARAVAREVGVSPDDVIVTNSTISEATGRHVVYVGVPYAQADWVCEADRNGRVVNVFYSGE